MLFIDMFLGFSVAIETSLAKSLKGISDPIYPLIGPDGVPENTCKDTFSNFGPKIGKRQCFL